FVDGAVRESARRHGRGPLPGRGAGQLRRGAGRRPGRAERAAVPHRPHGLGGPAGHGGRGGRGGAGAEGRGRPRAHGRRRRGRAGGLGGVAVRVLVADPISDQGLDVLRSAEGVEADVRTGLAPEELIEIIGEYDGLIVRSATRVTADVIEAGRRLKVVGRAGVGVDNIDVDAATRRGVLVINAPEGNTLATAEHTIAMMMALARWIPAAHVS